MHYLKVKFNSSFQEAFDCSDPICITSPRLSQRRQQRITTAGKVRGDLSSVPDKPTTDVQPLSAVRSRVIFHMVASPLCICLEHQGGMVSTRGGLEERRLCRGISCSVSHGCPAPLGSKQPYHTCPSTQRSQHQLSLITLYCLRKDILFSKFWHITLPAVLALLTDYLLTDFSHFQFICDLWPITNDL